MSRCSRKSWSPFAGVGALVASGGVVALVFFFLVVSCASPPPARAFIGESLVIGGLETLTSPAETILKSPTFLAEEVGEAAAEGGAVEAGAAASVEEGSLVPLLGPGVLALGAGVGVGSLICHVLGEEGCLFFSSEGAQVVAPGAPGCSACEWVYWGAGYPTSVSGWYRFVGSAAYPDAYWFRWSSSSWPNQLQSPGIVGVSSQWATEGCELDPAPPGVTAYVVSEVGGSCLEGHQSQGHGAVKSAFQGRKVEHVTYAQAEALRSAGRVSSEPAFTPPSGWSHEIAVRLEGAGAESPQARFGQAIAHAISPSTVADPYAVTSPLPSSCSVGAKVGPCIAALKELEVVPQVTELDWEHAVVEELEVLEPEKTREEDAERIVDLPSPLPSEVTQGQDFPLTVNPPEEEMPRFIPEPGEGETEEEYKERKAPWIPLPFWHAEELDDATLDPSKGPEEITHMSPAPGTRVAPDGETDEHVRYNPRDAPAAGEAGSAAGGGSSPPAIDSIDMSPLSGLDPCGVFPFGLFCWIGDVFSEVAGSVAACPDFSPELPGITGGVVSGSLDLCSEPFPELRGYARPIELFLFTIGVGIMFARATRAFGPGE